MKMPLDILRDIDALPETFSGSIEIHRYGEEDWKVKFLEHRRYKHLHLIDLRLMIARALQKLHGEKNG